MSFPRYPKYKDSAVEWLGEVPEHWEVQRLRFVADLNPSAAEIKLPPDTLATFLPMEAIGTDGTINLELNRPMAEVVNGYSHFRNDDVVVAKITPCFENGKGAVVKGLTNGIGFGTTELIVVRPRKNRIEPSYLHYVFQSTRFLGLGEGRMFGAGGQKRVPDSFVRDFEVPFPTVSEQRLLLTFLDDETAKIDALIAEQQKVIELLQEKRQAVISHAVTKGLDPDALMKASGVEWIGEVPAHWTCTRNKTVFREVDDRAVSNEGELMTVSHITGVTTRAEKDVNMFLAESLEGYKKCQRGDLVINTMWAWMGALGSSPRDGLVSPSYNVYRPTSAVLPAFYDYLARIPSHRVAIKANSTGIWESRLRLYPDAFLGMRVALPPTQEQAAIVAFLDERTTGFDNLIDTARLAVDLLQERGSALISAAVTGQIDVRSVA